MKPITPDEVEVKGTLFPEGVIEAWNELIAKNYSNGMATILQKDAAQYIMQKMQCTKEQVYANKWLDIAGVYQKHGWVVHYDRPAYCETYDPSFIFRKR